MNHSHVLFDSDPHFKIDPISRKIINESSTKTTIIQHDHNSERFTFECPRFVEGHDLSCCDIVEVHYLNIESNTKLVAAGVYTVEDLQVKADDENTVVCSWLVSRNATQLVGQLNFLVRFSCTNETTGKFEYVWNTAVYSGITVSSGIYNNDTDSDNPVPAYNFVTTITGDVLKFFVGTQEEYNALPSADKQNLFAIITDDKTKEEIDDAIRALQTVAEDATTLLNGLLDGSVEVAKASSATNATHLNLTDGITFDIESGESDATELEWGALYLVVIKSDITIEGDNYSVPTTCTSMLYMPLRPEEQFLRERVVARSSTMKMQYAIGGASLGSEPFAVQISAYYFYEGELGASPLAEYKKISLIRTDNGTIEEITDGTITFYKIS